MNNNLTVIPGSRILFMDRLRLILVVIVVFMHSACAYTNIIPWWSVQETVKSPILDFFALFVDGFQMTLLFFISGYFAWFSLGKRSRREFIVTRLRRIGLPFVAVGIFLTPYISYVDVRRVLADSPGFFRFWLFQMKTAADFTPVLFSDMEVARMHWMDYGSWHLWFVFVLLAFYFLYAAFDFLKERIFTVGASGKRYAKKDMVIALTVSGLIMSLLYSLVYLYVPDWVWGKLSVFSAQPVRMPVYLVIFFLGVYAGSHGWFVKIDIPGRTWIWGIISVMLSVLLVFCMFYMFMNWTLPRAVSFSLLHGLVRGGVTITMLGFLFKYASGRNKKNRLIDSAAGYAYEIYIIHLPLVIIIAYFFTFIKIPVLLKFIFVGSLVTCISYLLGRYIIKPFPKTATALIAAVFLILCIVYR